MKKLLILLLLPCIAFQVQAQTRAYQIGMMLDYRTPVGDSLLMQLKHEIFRVVGEDAEIILSDQYTLVNGANIAQAQADYQQLLDAPVDAILVLGTMGELALADISSFARPTVIYGDYHLRDVTDQGESRENVIHLLEQPTITNDLNELHRLTNFQRVGVVVANPYAQALDFGATLDKITGDLGAEYQLITYDRFQEVQSSLDGIDALYLTGAYLEDGEAINTLASVLQERKIPSMTTGGVIHLRQGLMATTTPRSAFDQIVRNVSLAVDAFVQGEPLPDTPVVLDYGPQLTMNFNVAEVVGVDIPYSSVDYTDFIGNANRLTPAQTFDLPSFLVMVLGENLSFQGAAQEVRLKSQDLKTAKSNYLPTLTARSSSEYVSPEFAEASFGQNAEFQTVGNVSLNQTLFSPQANANIAIEKNLLNVQEQRLSVSELDLVLDASNAYYNTLLAKSAVNIQAGNLRLTKTNYEVARQNYEAGQTNKSDLLRLESRLALDKQQMVQAINRLEQALLVLNQLVNNPLQKKIDIEDIAVGNGFFHDFDYAAFERLLDSDVTRERFVQFLAEESSKNSPELKALAHLDEVTNLQLKLFGPQRLLPTVGVEAGYINFLDRRGTGSQIEGFNFPNDYYTVGLGISIPIINGNRNNISHQRAKIQKDQISLNALDTKQSLETAVRNVTFEVINQMATIKLTRETERTAKEALALIQDAYSNGAVSVVQLFDVQNTYLQAQISRTQADYGYLMSVTNLERIIAHYSALSSEKSNQELKQRFLTFQK